MLQERAVKVGMPRAHLAKFDEAIGVIGMLENLETKNAGRNTR